MPKAKAAPRSKAAPEKKTERNRRDDDKWNKVPNNTQPPKSDGGGSVTDVVHTPRSVLTTPPEAVFYMDNVLMTRSDWVRGPSPVNHDSAALQGAAQSDQVHEKQELTAQNCGSAARSSEDIMSYMGSRKFTAIDTRGPAESPPFYLSG